MKRGENWKKGVCGLLENRPIVISHCERPVTRMLVFFEFTDRGEKAFAQEKYFRKAFTPLIRFSPYQPVP